MVEVNPAQAEIFGFIVGTPAEHPLDGSLVFWSPESTALRKIASAGEIRILDPFEYIGLQIAAFYRMHPEEALTLADVHAELKELERKHPGLFEDAIDRRFLNAARLTEVMQELVRQGLGVRDIRSVIELIASYCSSYAKSELEPGDYDLQEIVSFIRMARRRQLISRVLSERRTLRVVTLSSKTEEALESGSNNSTAESPGLDRLRSTLMEVVEPLRGKGRLPVSLLCKADLREQLIKFTRSLNVSLPILAKEELDPLVPVEKVGVWHLS
jgi:flagellar biosynthesis component FlhA